MLVHDEIIRIIRVASPNPQQEVELLQGTPALWRSLVSAGYRGHGGDQRNVETEVDPP